MFFCLSACGHVARPAVAEVPVFIIDEFETGEGEFIFEECGEFILDGFGPFAYEDNEFVDGPGDTSAWDLGVVALEFGVEVFGLCLEEFFCPHLSVELRVVDEGFSFFRGVFDDGWGEFFFADAKEGVVGGVVPEDTDARHLLVE